MSSKPEKIKYLPWTGTQPEENYLALQFGKNPNTARHAAMRIKDYGDRRVAEVQEYDDGILKEVYSFLKQIKENETSCVSLQYIAQGTTLKHLLEKVSSELK